MTVTILVHPLGMFGLHRVEDLSQARQLVQAGPLSFCAYPRILLMAVQD